MDAPLDEFYGGFLGNFLSKNLKTYQVEVNTDEKTLKPIARLKEPRDLFALPKDKDHDCSQQASRWPVECQVLDERIHHIEYVPEQPEPYYQSTGYELRPRPVGEENGIVIFNYNPVSAVNYKNEQCTNKKNDSDDSESDSSADESRSPSPEYLQQKNTNNYYIMKKRKQFSKIIRYRSSSSNSNDDCDDDDDDDDDDNDNENDNCYDDDYLNNNHDNRYYNENNNKKIKKQTNNIYKKCYINRNPQPVPTPKIIPQIKPCKLTIKKLENDSINDNKNYFILDENNLNHNDNKDDNNYDEITSKIQTISINYDNDNCENNNNNNCNTAQFSRSSAGGSKFLLNVHPCNDDDNYNDLIFESRFESGNLAKAVKITSTYYELYLRPDLYTNRHKQWFYFRVTNTKKNMIYRFSIVNLVKSDSLYNEGMRPLMYSTMNAKEKGIGWRRCGENISYYRNDDESSSDEDEDNGSYTLTFNIQFPNDADTVYFAHSYPYTYSDLQDYLMDIQRHPVKSKFCKLRLLCRSLAGNNVYYLTVTAPSADEEANKVRKKIYKRKKRAIIVTARVHPGETPSSWIMKGLMDFITGDTPAAKRLRHKFIFKLVPMLNPDGVIVGNTRSSLTGKDLNRQYRTVIRETYPSIWYTKAMIKRLIDDCGVAMYCDMHAHSRKHNIFIYGCENKRNPEKKLCEQVFPLMVHKNVADKFSFESCKFKIQRSKEGTGRIVIWMLGVTNSYTMEASFGGSTIGSRNGTHFSTAERLRNKIIERLLKEGSSADEPLNIPLSDYSSDEGDTTSSSSDNEGKSTKYSDYEGPCCQPLKAPPCSPILNLSDGKNEDKMMKKVRIKCKSSSLHKRKKLHQRTPLDLPTTDPGSDAQLSTDDEEYYNDNKLLTSKNYRSPYDNDDDDNDEQQRRQQRMPPELIVTPAKQSQDQQQSNDNKIINRNSKLSSSSLLTEFPPITGARRTNSWHNLNSNNSNSKILTKLRNQNSITSSSIETSESLNYKLSLKKKIWVGVIPEGSKNCNDRNRPLSWGIPPILRHKKTNHRQIKDKSETLLIACSKRLAALQAKEYKKENSSYESNNDDNESSFELKLNNNNNNKKYSVRNARTSTIKNKMTINLVVPVIPDKLMKSQRNSSTSKHTLLTSSSIKTDSFDSKKIKKKKNPLSKIAETTTIITRMAKSKAKNSLKNRKLLSSKSSSLDIKATNTAMLATTPNIISTSLSSSSIIQLSLKSTSRRNSNNNNNSKSSNKFKTGGLVATAVQQPINKKKKVRLIPIIVNNKNNTNEQNNSIQMESSDQENKTFIKKFRTKIKKKKRKNNNTSGIT